MSKPEKPGTQPDELSAVAALGEPTRRSLYDYVVGRSEWVSRDEAAESVGLERSTAAYHLDKLAADGLVDVEYRRLGGKDGPGAGRPTKLYRRASRDFSVSLPPRQYGVAGELLAEAVDRAHVDGTDVVTALDEAARAAGERLASDLAERVDDGDADGRDLSRSVLVLEELARYGFEPEQDADGTVVLRNCPFHQLARQHTEIICGMNLCLLSSVLESVGQTGLEARLEPEEGNCCVKLHRI